MLCYSLETFAVLARKPEDLICVINPSHEKHYLAATADLKVKPRIVLGGESRQESVLNALKSIEGQGYDLVVIHDAARPCIRVGVARKALDVFKKDKKSYSATLACRVSDTLRRGDDKNIAGEVVDRTHMWGIQTPQFFDVKKLLAAHISANEQNLHFTDDTSLMDHFGYQSLIIEGEPTNIKVTSRDDFRIVEAFIGKDELMSQTRTAMGFDVHAFEEDSHGDIIILCGVQIPSDKKLKGHSDADVGLHALTDALFGLLADGDIGTHFPPSDPQWKDADSTIFLHKALDMLHKRGGVINHIDLTLICESPKITPHRDAIIKRVADLCGVPLSKVGLKATTTEKLGFTGRGEGIAAQAVVTGVLP